MTPFKIVFCLCVLGLVAAGMMLVVGYVPLNSWQGVPAHHVAIYSMTCGITEGLAVATFIFGMWR